MSIPTAFRARFWAAILLASVFGTNAGDLLAGPLHLGHSRGLAPLALLFAALLLVPALFGGRRSGGGGAAMPEAAFWPAVAVLRTGATNIADLCDHELHLRSSVLLAVLLAGFALLAVLDRALVSERGPALRRLGTSYWFTMLAAGVLGTVGGDVVRHGLGNGAACALLGIAAAPVLLARATGRLPGTLNYWLAVGLARTLGTAIGDTVAGSAGFALGVPLATLLSFLAFAGLLLVARPAVRAARPAPGPASPSLPSPAAPR